MSKNVVWMLFLLLAITAGAKGQEESWIPHVCQAKNTVHKLKLYVQEVFGGPHATVWEVAQSNNITNDLDQKFVVIDDLITSGPEPTSNKLGRAQGLVTTFANVDDLAIALSFSFVFTEGTYKGSTISILGRKSTLDKHQELPVVGGTGVFRMARGYCISDTYSVNSTTSYAIFEYTIYVSLMDQFMC